MKTLAVAMARASALVPPAFLVLATFLLLASAPLSAQTVKTLVSNGPVQNRYDIVILGDGYQQSEETKFDQDAQRIVARLFGKPVYQTYQTYFNVHTVFRASQQSGASNPTAVPPIVRNTAYGATYNSGGTQRCLYITNSSRARADSRLAPDVENSVMVVVNSSTYGGCGGSFAVSYSGSSGPEVQAHEFGHSFGGLADEYDYGRSGTYSGGEPSNPNITTDPTGQRKWPLWVGSQGVSAYQGAGYYRTGLWRPKSDCLMRSNNRALCPVCNEQLVKRCYVTVDPIDGRSPAATNLTVQKPAMPAFSITSLVPGSSSIEWSVNGTPVVTGSTSFVWDTTPHSSGSYTITAKLTDQTSYVRNDPSRLLESTTSWNVDLLSTQPGSYTTYGAGCPGSLLLAETCLAVNPGGAHRGLNTRAGVTYAIAATAPRDLLVRGFELHTRSGSPGSVPIAIELYTAKNGRPAARVGSGSMQVGPSLGWYEGTLTSTYLVRSGQTFFVAFIVPSTSIPAAVVTGTNTPYFRNDGPGGSWNGPITSYAWGYQVRCEGTMGADPSLFASGVPEIGTTFGLNLELAAPNAAAVLLIGGSNASWLGWSLPFELGPLGAPGCHLSSSGDLLLPLQVGPTGAAVFNISVPNATSLVDGVFYNQFLVVDPPANQLGIAWSNGGRGKIGKP